MSFSVIFAGTPDFAVPSLQALIDDPAFTVELVITQPDRPVGRKHVLTSPPVKVLAEQHGIQIHQPEKLTVNQLPTANCQLLVVVAYGMILPQEMLDLPEIAPINLHPSLLPKLRGATPMPSAILSGDAVTGITIQKMEMKMDSGPILAQITVPLDERETQIGLHDRLSILGASLLVETLKNPLQETLQDESAATYCQKFTREDGEVDPKNQSAEEIDRTVRALHPWPGVKAVINEKELKILETSLSKTEESIPLECKDSVLHLVRVQSPGKKAMSGKEWQRGV